MEAAAGRGSTDRSTLITALHISAVVTLRAVAVSHHVTVVLPPVHNPVVNPLFCCLVICKFGVIGPAMDTSPPMRLAAIVFQNDGAVGLGVTCTLVRGDIVVATDVTIVALRETRVNPIHLAGSGQKGFL